MKLCSRLLLAAATCLGVAVVACHSGAPVAARAKRVVVVSYDGLGYDLARSWVDGGVTGPDGLGGLEQRGLSGRLRPADPTLTSVNHIVQATGRRPMLTGVVGNLVRVPGRPITEIASGFALPIASEPLWLTARRQGRKVGVLLWPGCDNSTLARRADFGIVWPATPLAPSELLDLAPEDAVTGELPSADSLPGLAWRLVVRLDGASPAVLEWRVEALDGAADGKARYDTVAVRPSDSVEWTFLAEREWFALEGKVQGGGEQGQHRYGSWSLPASLDRQRGSLRLYRGAFYRLLAYPEPFAALLEASVGFWPGPPDNDLLASWWLDAGQGLDLGAYLDQLQRLDRYLDQVAAEVLAKQPFHLLLAYHPTPDEYQHSSLIVDQRQWAYSPGRALAAKEGMRTLGRSIELSVATLWRALNPTQDVLAVVSDHGLAPMHDLVELNRVLADVGLVKLVEENGRTVVAASSPMIAVPNGACAHVYLNLRGRDPGGVVEPARSADLLRQAARALADLVVEGEPVVERVVSRPDAAALGLDHPATGDLVVFLTPGFGTSWDLSGPPLRPSRSYGEHGYLSQHGEMTGVLLAAGAGIEPRRVEEAAAADVAGLVSRWLGIQPPAW